MEGLSYEVRSRRSVGAPAGERIFNKGRVCVPLVCVSRSDRHMRHAEPVCGSLLRGLLSE